MKKRLLIISLIVACLAVCAGGSLAYFNVIDTERNVITAGNIKIELIETDKEGNPFENAEDVMPGAVIEKVVTVKSTGDNDCWVRIKADKEIILDEGVTGAVDLSLIELDLNTADWTEKDGFYYYNEKLEAGETTTPLFTTVTFNTAMDNLYKNCTANINVQAQAVQCANNGSTVLEANGWPAE